jgi:tetratricopeptide (TPR) repeat protein
MAKQKKKKTQVKARKYKGKSSNKPNLAYNPKYNKVLERAQICLDNGRNDDAILEVETLLNTKVRETDLMAFIFAARINGFALANLKQYNEVVRIALEVITIDPQLLDFYYLLSYGYLSMQDYSLAEVYSKKFIDLASQQSLDWTAPHMISETRPKTYDVHNFLAVALKGQGRFQEAGQEFAKAYQYNPKFVTAYINHAQLMHGQGDDNAARDILQIAVKAKVNAEEIKMLLKAYEPKPRVSVCMIVKNEEKMLDNCLNSIEGFVDELIIVDTGSTDSTVEIAKRHGAKVYFHEWENDFSKARNYSLSYATNEWIFIMDADEEVVREDHPRLREIMTQQDYNLVSINVYNLGPEGSAVSSFLPSIRMFRRSVGAKYDGIVHNQLKFDQENEKIVRIDARIKHYGYGLDPESMKNKIKRSRTLLLKQIEDNPENYFAHFNLAQIYRGESPNLSPENCANVIEHASKVVDNTDPYTRGQRHLHLMSLHQLVSANFFLSEYDKAIEYCKKAIEYKPNFLDPIISLGHIYSQKGDLEQARIWFMNYLDALNKYDETQETDQIILLNLSSSHIAFCGLGYIAERENKQDEAIGWFQKCLEVAPDYQDLNFRLGRLLYNRGRHQEALQLLDRELHIHTDNWAAYFTQGEVYNKVNNHSAAEESYLQAFRLKDDNSHILYSLARLYAETNRPEEAMKYLKTLQEVDKEFVNGYRLMGDISFQFGNYREATAAYTNFVIRNANDLEVWNNLGNSYFKLGEFDQACQSYEKVIELDNSYSLAYRNLAVCYTQMNELEKAYAILEDYLILAPDDIDLLVMAGEISFNIDKYEQAVSYFEKAIALKPESPELLTMLGDCYYACGYYESAKMGYLQALKVSPEYSQAKEKLAKLDEISTAKNG